VLFFSGVTQLYYDFVAMLDPSFFSQILDFLDVNSLRIKPSFIIKSHKTCISIICNEADIMQY